MYFIFTQTAGKHRETLFPLNADFKILKIFELKRMENKLKQNDTRKHHKKVKFANNNSLGLIITKTHFRLLKIL
jgi:hypothetical protein